LVFQKRPLLGPNYRWNHKAGLSATNNKYEILGLSSGRQITFRWQDRSRKLFMKTLRNFDEEIKDSNGHKYVYNFDTDVMHPFMLKAFKPFFRQGNLLELGSFKGEFTKRFNDRFDVKLQIAKKNQSPAPLSFRELVLTPELIERITEVCQPDIQVYEYALQNFRDKEY